MAKEEREGVVADRELISGAFAVFLLRVRKLGYDILPHTTPLTFAHAKQHMSTLVPSPDSLPVRFAYAPARPPRRAKRPRAEYAPAAAAASSGATRKRARPGGKRDVSFGAAAEVEKGVKRPDVTPSSAKGDGEAGPVSGVEASLKRQRRKETSVGGGGGARRSGVRGDGAGPSRRTAAGNGGEGGSMESDGDKSAGDGAASGGAESWLVPGVPFSPVKPPSSRQKRRRASLATVDGQEDRDQENGKSIAARRAAPPVSTARVSAADPPVSSSRNRAPPAGQPSRSAEN